MLAESFDPAKNERYLSPIGGGIDFGEKSRDAAIREVKEELGEEVDQLKLLGVIENLFMFNGQEGHEIVFIYEARFKDSDIYQKHVLPGIETSGHRFEARWYDLKHIKSRETPVYPQGIIEML
ncbi:NUDIX domain protein [Nitrincola nitratireducens]|uniref:NUDIX domain protein n=1 Tax=Nitrincola nitratireducens TaxID=1229521 RepID=W9V038_9GAMM|nr:NUDIX domain protein [Nitrincola nitratireducens]